MALNDKLINYGNLAEFHNQILNDTGSTTGVTWSAYKLESELASKQDTLVAGDGIQISGNTISATGSGGSGTTELMKSVTYAQLKALRDNSQLVKGQQYRITDFVTTCGENAVGDNDFPARSAGHQFDIIVTADDVDKLNENARAINHPGVIMRQTIKYHIDDNNGMGYYYNGAITIDGVKYYKWYTDEITENVFTILTTERVYTNTPDGEDGCGDYYLTTYPFAGEMDSSDELRDEDYWGSEAKKCVIKTDGLNTPMSAAIQVYDSDNDVHKVYGRYSQGDTTGQYAWALAVDSDESGRETIDDIIWWDLNDWDSQYYLYTTSETPSIGDTATGDAGTFEITDYQTNIPNGGMLEIGDAFNCENETYQEEYTSTDYFWKNDLSSWKLKYSLDNDTDRFTWADTNENPGLGFAAIKVNTTKTENVSKLIIGDNMNPLGDEFGNEHYYIDNGAFEHVYQGTINYNGTTYYKWYEEYKNKTVLTTQATYSNSPSGTDEDGFTYYNNVYSIVGTITIDGETFDEFYKRDKKIIKTETSQVENNGSFLYKRYQAGDTSNTYAWVSVNYSFNKDINDAAVNWSDVDTSDIIYTDSETPSLDTVISGATIIEYSANVQENLPKGVIFDMIDEWNNHLNYDFKNIQYYNEDDDIWNYTFDDWDDIDNTLFGDSNNNNFVSSIYDGVLRLYKYAGVDKVGQSNLINIPVYNESTSIKINQISENNYTISANVRNPITITNNGIGLNFDNNVGLGIESEHGRLVVTPASSSKIGGVKIASDLFNIDEKGNISINLLKLRDTLSSEIMDYLTFEAINQTTIHFYNDGKTIETSKDGKNWTSYSNGGIVGSLEPGEKLYVRGDNTCYAIAGFNGSSGDYHSNSHFTVSDDCYLYGNIMSLINSTDYPNCNSLYHELHMNGNTWWYEEGFRGLFYSCTHLYSHPNKDLILPVKNLIKNCYKDLFRNCNNITRIKCLAQNIYYENNICTTDWLKGASSSGTLITPQSTNWTTGDSGIPSGWTRENS